MSNEEDVGLTPEQKGVNAVLERLIADLGPHLKGRGSFVLRVELDGINFNQDYFSKGATPEIVMMAQVAEMGAQKFISAIVGYEVGVQAVAIPKEQMEGNRTTLHFEDVPREEGQK